MPLKLDEKFTFLGFEADIDINILCRAPLLPPQIVIVCAVMCHKILEFKEGFGNINKNKQRTSPGLSKDSTQVGSETIKFTSFGNGHQQFFF